MVVLRFESGALGVIDNSRSAGYGYECSTELVGRSATVRIDQSRRHHYEWRTAGLASYEVVRDFAERFPWAYAAELESFARAVLDGQPPRVTGSDALAAFDLARAAERSWRTGQLVRLAPRRTADGVDYSAPSRPRPGRDRERRRAAVPGPPAGRRHPARRRRSTDLHRRARAGAGDARRVGSHIGQPGRAQPAPYSATISRSAGLGVVVDQLPDQVLPALADRGVQLPHVVLVQLPQSVGAAVRSHRQPPPQPGGDSGRPPASVGAPIPAVQPRGHRRTRRSSRDDGDGPGWRRWPTRPSCRPGRPGPGR